MGKNLYQNIRTQVKKNLKPLVVDRFGMEYAIRAEPKLPFEEAERALQRSLNERNFHVIHETDSRRSTTTTRSIPRAQEPEDSRKRAVHGLSALNTATGNDAVGSSVLPPGMLLYEIDRVTKISAVRPSTLLAVFRDGEIRDTVVEVESLFRDILESLPQSRMLSKEPPPRLGERSRRRTLKTALNLVVSLADAGYSIHVTSPRPPMEVKAQVRDALDRRGQKVLGEVADGRIMLVVNPGQAHKALAIEPDAGAFAPLSVSISRENGRTHVRTVRPTTLLIFFDQPAMQDILTEMEMPTWNGIVDGVPDATIESRQPPLQPEGDQRTTAGGLPGGLGAMDKRAGD